MTEPKLTDSPGILNSEKIDGMGRDWLESAGCNSHIQGINKFDTVKIMPIVL